MRIALCHHYSLSYGGGGERILADGANFLSQQGHDVSIRCLPFRRGRASFSLEDHIEHHEKPIHRFSADVAYHIYAPLTSDLFVSTAPKVAGLHGAVVADFDGDQKEFFKQGIFVAGAYVLRELLGCRALSRFDAVHTVNPDGLPIRHRRIFRIPNWVDCSKSDELLPIKNERQGKFRVLFVGKPSYTKGFDRFLALSDMFHDDDIEFVATFPPHNSKYTNNGKVRCLGHIPPNNIWETYSDAGVLLQPARKETFGLAILEALVSGTPVITTPISCHVSLKLPVHYASTLFGLYREVQKIFQLWKGEYDAYLNLAAEGARDARRYDRATLLPRFEDMLTQVANGGQNAH